MGKSKKKRVFNSQSSDNKVHNDKNDKLNINNSIKTVTSDKLAFDFSFEGLYYSVKLGNNFNNFLANEKEFIEKFRQIRKINSYFKDKSFKSLLNDSRSHCHLVKDIERNTVVNCVGAALSKFYNSDSVSENIHQLLGSEDIYQLGIDKGVRILGTYAHNTGIFRIYLIDYHHRLYPDERRNTHGDKELKFCPMKGK